MINYTNALLSDIAYVNFKVENNVWKLSDPNGLRIRGITQSEVDFFNLNFKVLDQENTSLTGFSATTFQITTNNVPGYKAGDIIVAYRGTEFKTIENKLNDIFYTDFLGVALGLGGISDILVEVIRGFGFDVDAIAQTTLAKEYMEEAQTKYSNITVTGHSLGGYLATYATLTNPENIKETITFNAAGMSLIDVLIGKVLDQLSAEGAVTTEEGLTAEDIKLISEKITHIYSATNLEFTSAGWNPLSTYIGNRIPIYTEDVGMVANHSVIYPRQAMFLYESLRMILQKTIANTNLNTYADITKILDVYKYPATEYDYMGQNHSETELDLILTQLTFEKHIKNLATMVGIPVTGSGFDAGYALLNHVYNNSSKLTFQFLPDVNPIKRSNSYNNRSALYALLNYMPFYLTSIDTSYSQKLNVDKYNPLNYSDEFINARFDYFKKAMIAADSVFAKNSYKLGDGRVIVLNTYFSINDGGEEVVYVDVENKIALLKNINDVNENILTSSSIKKVYFMYESIQSASFASIFGTNSKVFDSISNDIIYIKGQNISVYLSKGNDQVHIDVEYASLGQINIMDNAVGDKFFFHGGDLDNNITGTKYSDEFKGNYGNDSIYGAEGNDTLYGGIGSDTLDGGIGDDEIYGNHRYIYLDDMSDKNDVNIINGGYGIDTIYGGEGKDIINNVATSDGSFQGRLSTDKINKSYGDIITGGWGDDEIYGTAYGDTYYYYKGDGNDTIIERVSGVHVNETAMRNDKLFFMNLNINDLLFYHNNSENLYIKHSYFGEDHIITLQGFMNNYYIEEFYFSNGNNEQLKLSYTDILNKVLDRTSDISTRSLYGNDNMYIFHVETLRGLNGSFNIIEGGYGKDIIIGGDNIDIIGSGSINSTSYLGHQGSIVNSNKYGDDITGGKGDDIIYGTRYGDIYRYNIGDGFDSISEVSSNLDTQNYLIDKLILGSGITRENISFSRNMSGYAIIDLKFNDSSLNGQIFLKQFMSEKRGIEQIILSDGSIITSTEIYNSALLYYGTELGDIITGVIGDDVIHGKGGRDNINSGIGNDTVYGGEDNDYIDGASGNDFLYGEGGSDTIIGGDGVDTIEGGDGDDFIDGGKGKDILNGGDGDDIINYLIKNSQYADGNRDYIGDIITGGKGNDEIHGTQYADIFYYNLGDGKDKIFDYATSSVEKSVDTIIFGEGISPEEVLIRRDSTAVILIFKDEGEVRFENFYNNNYIEQLQFSDGTVWDWMYLTDHARYEGTINSDTLYGGPRGLRDDHIFGMDGDDFIYGLNGKNFLHGGNGNDTIGDIKNIDNDLNGWSNIYGDKGNDLLYGSKSSDNYFFNIGDGQDIILESVMYSYYNKIVFGEGIVFENLIFRRVNNNDLRISYTQEDYVTVKNFYFADDGITQSRRGVQIIEFSDGSQFNLLNNPEIVNILVDDKNGNNITPLYMAESIYAGDGDDFIIDNKNYTNNGSYYGNEGDDTIKVRNVNIIEGGTGVDTLTVNVVNRITGDEGDDIIKITGSGYYIAGNEGDDNISISWSSNNSRASLFNLYFNINDGKDKLNISGAKNVNLYFNTNYEEAKLIGSIYYNESQRINSLYLSYSQNDYIDISSNYLVSLNAVTNFIFNDRTVNIVDLLNNIYGTDQNDYYNLMGFKNATIKAGTGNDQLIGGTSNELVYMYGQSGADTLIARNGNVYMNGGTDSDTYMWKGNLSNITIDDNHGYDKLFISYNNTYGNEQNVSYSNIRMVKSGVDLVIFKGESALTVNNQFIEGQGIDQIGSGLLRNEFELMIDLMAQYDATSDSTEHTRLNSEMSRLWQ